MNTSTLALFLFLLPLSALAGDGDVLVMRQQNMGKWGIPGANYSGITHIRSNEYAVVSDKEEFDGFYLFNIDIDSVSGKITNVGRDRFINDYKPEGQKARDAEGIAYIPSVGSVFIAAESDQRIVEQEVEGRLTGRELKIPEEAGVKAIHGNYGFEALTYSSKDNTLWTVTENSLKADGGKCQAGDSAGCLLRFLSFDANTMLPVGQYAYRMDPPSAKTVRRQYAYGVSALCALDDGSLLVLEREFYVAGKYIGSFVRNKIYRVFPEESKPVTFVARLSELQEAGFMRKELVCDFKTGIGLLRRNLANYEGMCLGPRLTDGSQTLILISDSQNNHGNRLFRMKDYLKVIVLK